MERPKAILARLLGAVIAVAVLVMLLLFGGALFYGAKTIHDILNENKYLKQALTNLTREEQIGYAKVLSQEIKGGKLYTTLRFAETDRGNKSKIILTRDYTLEGDVVHFDALIVTFGDKMVMDGKAKALYLWRRVYGEHMRPSDGFPIEEPGAEPVRYKQLLDKLPTRERKMFWDAIWELAHDPDRLAQHDIKAVYGHAVYTKLQKGLVYVFKITPTGQVYPETVPEM